MAAAQKFIFNTDFRNDGRKVVAQADLDAARTAGFNAGQDQARREAEAQTGAMLAQLIRSADMLLAAQDERLAAIEEQAVHLSVLTAQRLAGAALADKPLAQLAGAARECLAHARSAPHLLIRVHESLIEKVESMVAGLVRETGFAGKLVVLGEPDMLLGDGRIEWADGGLVIDRSKIEQAVQSAVASVFGRSDPFGRAEG